MYENYSRQSLPSKKYRELLGSAICVFNSNNAFIIENILKRDLSDEYSWQNLIDRTSGKLKGPIEKTISSNTNEPIATLFEEITNKRNRIVHSFRITNKENEQSLATKEKNGDQFEITEDYLLEFIKLNGKLSSMLHDFRGY